MASFGLTEQNILSGKAGHRPASGHEKGAVGSATNGDGLLAAAAQGSGRDPPARAQFRWSSPAG